MDSHQALSGPRGSAPWRALWKAARAHFWFKSFGMTAFISLFFLGYFQVLRNPATEVTLMPLTALDRWLGLQPLALPLYLTLWVYVVLAPGLLESRRILVLYGAWIGGLCLAGLVFFYLWPTAVPPLAVDWSAYPVMAFLKRVDAAGNACPSLHVAAAVFSAVALDERLRHFGTGWRARTVSVLWCLGIVYSTLATRQHVALDVLAGGALGLAFALGYLRLGPLRQRALA